MKPLIVHAEAEAELDAAMQWYETQREGLGLALQDEVDAVFEKIEESPKSGWRYARSDYRVLPTNRFPYLVYYLETDEAIWVAAVAHERKRPDYWRNRLVE